MSLIDDEKYHRLRLALPDITRQSNVAQVYIENTAVGNVDREDLTYLKNYRQNISENKGGYLKISNDCHVKFLYMAGALIRNFIDARVCTIDQTLELDSNPTVLFIPDFCTLSKDDRINAPWRLQELSSLIISRFDGKRQTILAVRDKEALLKHYGSSLYDFLLNNYEQGEG